MRVGSNLTKALRRSPAATVHTLPGTSIVYSFSSLAHDTRTLKDETRGVD